jgi:stearoyl-CoA desaturase (delta-9 desaturase)
MSKDRQKQIKFIRTIGILINITITLGSLIGVFLFGVSWFAFFFFIISAYLCMFFQEAFYHRYFAHQSFKTSRVFQFIMGFLAELAPVRGPIWWAANHRDHHRFVDTERDPHAPLHGFARCYMGWAYTDDAIGHDYQNTADLNKFWELRLLDRFYWFPMVLSFVLVFLLGRHLQIHHPEYNTSGMQLLVWGGFLRVLYPIHIMAMVNFFAHSSRFKVGYRNFNSPDLSRNVAILGILGAGVGWHNNHHRSGRTATTRVMWWEIDPSGMLLFVLEKLGVIWDVRWLSEKLKAEAKSYRLK